MKLFGTAGIRMKYPSEIDPVLAFKIGNAVGKLKLANESYIVHDTRVTGPILALSFCAGLMSSGVSVTLVGLGPTPVAAYVARREKSIGISITASHNPPEYNGFKLYDVEGFEFTRDLEERVEIEVENIVLNDWYMVGEFRESNKAIYDYVEDIVDFVGSVRSSKNINIMVDCANGATYYVSPEVIRRLGGKPYTFNCNPNGHFPVRLPEPRRDILERLLPLYSAVKPAVIFAHDGDGDRVAVLDPVKGFIRQDRILAFFAKKILEERKGHVIVSIDTGYVVDEVVYELGGSIERYLLGKTHERVKDYGLNKVVMAGEPWKLIHTSWGPWVDGVLQVALITRSVLESDKQFSKLLDDEKIPDYPWDRRSYVIEPVSLRDRVYREVVDEVSSLLGDPDRVIDIDGYRFEYKDYSWILIRKSGTEPKIRIYAEARDRNRLKYIIEVAESVINRVVKKLNGRIVEVTVG